jgi:hypothetical protein
MPCPELNEPPRCLTSAAQTRQRKNTLPSFPQPTKNHPGARRRQHQWAAAGARQVSKAEALARRRANATAAQGATGVPGRGGVGAQGAQGCDGAAPCQRALHPRGRHRRGLRLRREGAPAAERRGRLATLSLSSFAPSPTPLSLGTCECACRAGVYSIRENPCNSGRKARETERALTAAGLHCFISAVARQFFAVSWRRAAMRWKAAAVLALLVAQVCSCFDLPG